MFTCMSKTLFFNKVMKKNSFLKNCHRLALGVLRMDNLSIQITTGWMFGYFTFVPITKSSVIVHLGNKAATNPHDNVSLQNPSQSQQQGQVNDCSVIMSSGEEFEVNSKWLMQDSLVEK